ncbi:MAG TPA: FAD-dependent monooxygenase, partial [Chloroflexota bacterium]|nr:FAD-dependent monooxygenase [Chloroflexota bacterium]
MDPITDACIVGGGPAGMMLGLILARRGVSVTLLEAHADFDRDFRGDTLHPGALEIVEHLGLAEALHRLPHHKAHSFSIPTPDGPVEFVDFRRVGGMRFPYVMLVAQSRFLDLLAAEAGRYPHFRLVMRA